MKYSNAMTYALGIAVGSENLFRVGAVILDKKGNIIAKDTNKMRKTHPVQARYAWKANREEKVFLHAEISAIIRCRKAEPYKMFVARILRNGEPASSKPCEVCSLAIEEAGISYVHYLDEQGRENVMKI